MDSMVIHIANLGADMLTNPISCSIAREHVWILQQFTLETLAQTCLQTLAVVQLCIEMMDSMAIPMANLGTDMLTNPTAVLLHVKTI